MERDTMIEDTVTQNSDVRSVQDLRRSEPQGSRVEINGMSMYYEVSGSGDPLIVLHGAYQNIPTMGEIVPRLAEGHRVYALEFQGHGRTTDIPRPITYQNLADDVAAFINALSLKKPNIFGYSMGAGAAVQLAIRHPEIVNRVAVASATFDAKGFQPAFTNMLPSMVPEMFVGSPMEAAYRELAPNGDFRALVEKLIALEHEPMSWAEDLKKISAPMLLIVGDADVVTLEHAIEMFRLLGGGVMGDMGTPLPASRLAVLPASSHTALINQPEVLHTFIYPFLRGKQPKGMFE
jgi:pimeloyl-ACP methyl ester carboxylesterase